MIQDHHDQVKRFLMKYYRGIGTPLARRQQWLLERDEWTRLQQARVGTPANYPSAEEYRLDALSVEITRKLLLPGDTGSRRDAAIRTFWDMETHNARTNARLSRFVESGPFEPHDEPVMQFVTAWRKELRRVLGKPSYYLTPRFSSGATLSDQGNLTTIPDKMSSRPTAYARSVKHYDLFRFTPQHERWPLPDVRRGNRFFTVPKDCEKDRGCCTEASVNVQLQLDVGRKMKALYLKAYQVDLRHAKPVHMDLARKASSGELALATIDLSNASDTVARKLVQLLLPQDWFSLLNSLRAPITELDGHSVWLEKFSSMGNGFTFELETIIFRTLLAVLGCETAYVFGDDIVCDLNKSRDVIAALRFFGFLPNVKKTFCEGPFRESCGGDYFHGVDVRAHYLKELPDEPQKWIALANGLRRVDPDLRLLKAAWHYCLDQLPTAVRRCRGPRELGDIVIWDDSAEPVVRGYSTRSGGSLHANTPIPFWRCYLPVQTRIPLGVHWSYRVATASASLKVPPMVAPRDSIQGYRLGWVPVWGVEGTGGWCGQRGLTPSVAGVE